MCHVVQIIDLTLNQPGSLAAVNPRHYSRLRPLFLCLIHWTAVSRPKDAVERITRPELGITDGDVNG